MLSNSIRDYLNMGSLGAGVVTSSGLVRAASSRTFWFEPLAGASPVPFVPLGAPPLGALTPAVPMRLGIVTFGNVPFAASAGSASPVTFGARPSGVTVSFAVVAFDVFPFGNIPLRGTVAFCAVSFGDIGLRRVLFDPTLADSTGSASVPFGAVPLGAPFGAVPFGVPFCTVPLGAVVCGVPFNAVAFREFDPLDVPFGAEALAGVPDALGAVAFTGTGPGAVPFSAPSTGDV